MQDKAKSASGRMRAVICLSLTHKRVETMLPSAAKMLGCHLSTEAFLFGSVSEK